MSPHEHLTLMPADERLDLLAPPVAAVIWSLPSARVFEIDPDLADTAALCAAYDLPLSTSANCVVVTGRRAGQERHAACVALATTRVNVNSVVRRRLDVRKVSFSPREATVANTGMEFWWDHAPWASPGWPIWIDAEVAATDEVVVGSGTRTSKLVVSPTDLLRLPGTEVVQGLATAPN